MGGMISLVYAATYPQRLGRLVIVDSITQVSMDQALQLREFSARPARAYATREELVARYRLEPAGEQFAAPEVLRRMALHSGRRDAEGHWRHKADRRVYRHFEPIDGVPLWGRVTVPALVVRGEHSARFGPEVLAGIRAGAPQMRSAEVPGPDHHVTLDNPGGFVKVVREFLRTA